MTYLSLSQPGYVGSDKQQGEQLGFRRQPEAIAKALNFTGSKSLGTHTFIEHIALLQANHDHHRGTQLAIRLSYKRCLL